MVYEEGLGEELRRKRVRLDVFKFCFTFPTKDEASAAAESFKQLAIHKKYRDRDRVVQSGNTVCVEYYPSAYMNDYPRSFVHDVVDRIYRALEVAYRRWAYNGKDSLRP